MRRIVSLGGHRVGVEVMPPPDLDLQFIYRAAISIYWNEKTRQLEDHYEREESHVASMQRVVEALRDEYRLELVAGPALHFDGISEPDRALIESILNGA